MRSSIVLLLILLFAADSNSQIAVNELTDNAAMAARRVELMGPRLPSESENPDAPRPSELQVTSSFFGPVSRVSLSRNPKTTMNLPESFGADCPLIAGDLVSLTYVDGDPLRPKIERRISGGDWCTISHPPGLYTGPCSATRPQSAPGSTLSRIALEQRSVTTWFRDESGDRRSVAANGCSPVKLEAGRYRIYIEVDTKLSASSPCADDATKDCTRPRYVKTIFEGGISIDPALPERSRITDIAPLVPAWSGTDPVPSFAERAPTDVALRSDDAPAPDYDPNNFLFGDLLGAVFKHDRCTNCHSFEAPGGKLEIHIEDIRLADFDDSAYEPGKDMSRQLIEWIDDWYLKFEEIGCHACHNPEKTQLNGFQWMPAIMMANAGPWDRMGVLEICDRITANIDSGFGPEEMRAHLLNDPRIRWAIRNRWTPDLVIQPAPPLSWNEFVINVNLWIDNGLMRCRPATPLTPEERRRLLIPESTPAPKTTPVDETDRTPPTPIQN